MDTFLKGYYLPKEIVELIFGYLDKDNDIKNCRLVCSNWNSNVYSICFKCAIQVALGTASRCEKLMKDLVEFPQLVSKVRKLCLSYIDEDPIEPNMFVSLLDQCTYIENLRFCINQTGEQYLLALFNNTPHISRMKEITVDKVHFSSRPIRISHLLINFVYRNSITVLEISDVRNETAAGISVDGKIYIDSAYKENSRLSMTLDFMGESCHTLIEFATKFPKLKVLKLLPGLLSDDIDISALMEANMHTLETLHIFGSHCNLDMKKPFYSWPNVNPCNSITEIDIRVLRVCAGTLECVMTLTNLQKLVINLELHSTFYERSSFDKDKSQLLIDRFTLYCNRVKKVEVYMVYETFAEDNAIVRRQMVTQDGRLIDMEHKISSCCSDLNIFFTRAFNIEDYDITDQNVYIYGDGDTE